MVRRCVLLQGVQGNCIFFALPCFYIFTSRGWCHGNWMARREEHYHGHQLISIGSKNAPIMVWHWKLLFPLFLREGIASRCARMTAAGENDTGFSCCILQYYHLRDAVRFCFGNLRCHRKYLLDLFQFTPCVRSRITLLWSLWQSTRKTNFSTCTQGNVLQKKEDQKQLQNSP